jgi:hypothetical protein
MDTRFATIPGICKVAPEPTRIPAPAPSMALLYESMDDTGMYAQTMRRPIPADPDDVFSECDDCDDVTDADRLIDVCHDMRLEWQFAIDHQHALSTPKLPTVNAGKLVMVPVTELVGTLMETQWSVQLLCDALRTGDTTKLHLHLRSMWIDGYSQELAAMGWAA